MLKPLWMKWTLAALFVVILALSLGLRFHQIGKQSLWSDEIYFANFVLENPTLSQMLDKLKTGDHAPMYLMLLRMQVVIQKAWHIPVTEASLRFLAALFGVLAVPAVFLLFYRIFSNPGMALLGMLLAAVNMFGIFYSQEVRMYTCIIFLATMLLYFQLTLWEKDTGALRIGSAIGFVVTATLLIYLGVITLFLVAAVGLTTFVWAWLERKRYPKQWKQVILLGAAILVLVLPWLGEMLKKSLALKSGVQGQVITNPRELFKFGIENMLFHSWRVGAGYTLVNRILRIVMLFSLVHLLDPVRRREHAMVLVNFVIMFTLYFIITYNKNFQFGKYVSPWWPFALYFVVAGSWGIWRLIDRFRPQWNKISLGLISLGLIGFLFVQAQQINYYFQDYYKENWRDAVRYLNDHPQPGDVLLVESTWQQMCLTYYRPNLPLVTLEEVQQTQLPSKVKTPRRILFLPVQSETTEAWMKKLQFQKQVWPIAGMDLYVLEQ